MPVEHYENFPVASRLLPPELRAPIEAIYGFARGADDIADEGDLDDAARLAGLDAYLRALDEIERGGTPPDFPRIAAAIRDYGLPVPLLRALVDAFKQDVVKKRYATYAELLDYSRRSANPVGRLLLHLFERTGSAPGKGANGGPPPAEQSDAICSSLQFINFWQDVAVDWRKGRVYIPLEDLARFGVEERQIADGIADEKWRALMGFECERSRSLMHSGAPLGRALPGRVGVEIRATITGGLTILDKIEAAKGDVFRHRPVLRTFDWMKILARSL